jgi:hypothetical protein
MVTVAKPDMLTPAAAEKPPFDLAKRPQHKVDFDQVKVGDLLLLSRYVTVATVTKVADSPGVTHSMSFIDCEQPWQVTIEGEKQVTRITSADLVVETVKLPRAEIIKILLESAGRPITINWTKKDGASRTLRGRFASADKRDLGYSYVVDLDLPRPEEEGGTDNRLRLVDHRTLHWLIDAGVKYESTSK